MTIHSSGQTIFSFSHIEGITLGKAEEIDEVAGGANGLTTNGYWAQCIFKKLLSTNMLIVITN